jgi:hypothetical protein
MIATTSIPRNRRRLGLAGSWNKKMPRVAAPTVPMPTHTP